MTTGYESAAALKAARKANYAAQKAKDNGSRKRSGNPGTRRDESGLRTVEKMAAVLVGLTPPVMKGVGHLEIAFSLVRTGVYALKLTMVPEAPDGEPVVGVMGEITPPADRVPEFNTWADELVIEIYNLMPRNVLGNRLLAPFVTAVNDGAGPVRSRVYTLPRP